MNREINFLTRTTSETIAPMIRQWWIKHHTAFLRVAVVLMAILALLKLGIEFWRLLFDTGPDGAVDLNIAHRFIQHWFSGKPTYQELRTAVYPPASYLLLWPFLGWLGEMPARWFWGVTTTGALIWLVFLILRESRATTSLERWFIALMLLSMNATGVTIGNGQRILHLLPMLLAGFFLLDRNERSGYQDLTSAGLILFTLVAPNISAPFFWLAVFIPRTRLPALLIILGYILLTVSAMSFQELNFTSLLTMVVEKGMVGIRWGSKHGGYANLHTALVYWGMKRWIIPVSLAALAGLGFWIYRYRSIDRWLLLGVTALFARFWAYHRLYDNLLILIPMIALFRIAKRGPVLHGEDVTAGFLLGITSLIMLAPARLLIAPPPWSQLFKTIQVIVWMGILIFFLHQAWMEKKMQRKRFVAFEN